MPRCKECGDKFVSKYFNQKFCLEKDECILAHSNLSKQNEWNKRKKKLKKDLLTVQDWLKIAQQAFNAYIRERDKGKPCVSCGKELKGKFDAGHYISSGSCKSLTFDENNVHGQCVECNQHKHGNLIAYREGLLERIGIVWLQHLEIRRNEAKKYTREELESLTKEYKRKLKELKQQ